MATSMVLDAIEQSIWTRQQEGVLDLKDVVHQTDRGSQYTSIRFSERLAQAGIQPSVGAVGDRMTTPRWSRVGPGCRSSCSTPANGPRPWSWLLRWPITSTTSTTSNAVTATSVTSALQSSKRSGRQPIHSLDLHTH